MKYTYSVFIGRFQPFHDGHLRVVEDALKQSEYLIIVLGSCNQPRNTRNPLTYQERIDLIQASLPDEIYHRVRFAGVSDHMYNDTKWITEVQSSVWNAIHNHSGFVASPYKIALAGMSKDATSYYLKRFPNWSSIAVEPVLSAEQTYSSTDIREQMYRSIRTGTMLSCDYMNKRAVQKLNSLMDKNIEEFMDLNKDFEYELHYESQWGKGPHLTVDAVVVQSGFICLIQRGGEYGHLKWALPGGFIEQNETLENAMIRELREETRIKVPEPVLRGSIVQSKIFDNPHRSLRGRIITQAFHIQLKYMNELPKVKGSDDAMNARWFPISEVSSMRDHLFEDHWWIIEDMLKI